MSSLQEVSQFSDGLSERSFLQTVGVAVPQITGSVAHSTGVGGESAPSAQIARTTEKIRRPSPSRHRWTLQLQPRSQRLHNWSRSQPGPTRSCPRPRRRPGNDCSTSTSSKPSSVVRNAELAGGAPGSRHCRPPVARGRTCLRLVCRARSQVMLDASRSECCALVRAPLLGQLRHDRR